MTRANFQSTNNSNELRVKRYLNQALSDKQQCLRIVLNEYLNERTNRRGCEKEEESCDNCRARRVLVSMMTRFATKKKKKKKKNVNEMFELIDMQLQTLMKTSLSIVALNRVLNSFLSLRVDRNDVIKSSTFNAQISRRLASIVESFTSKLSTQEKQRYRQQKEQRMTLQERRQEQIKSTRSTQARFAQRLKYWKQRCVWCQIYLSEKKIESHNWVHCVVVIEKKTKMLRQYDDWRRQLRKSMTYSSCFDCWLSQTLCVKWTQSEQNVTNYHRVEETWCQHRNTLFETIDDMLTIHDRALKSKYRERVQNSEQKSKKMKYLRDKWRWSELKCNNLVQEFVILNDELKMLWQQHEIEK